VVIFLEEKVQSSSYCTTCEMDVMGNQIINDKYSIEIHCSRERVESGVSFMELE